MCGTSINARHNDRSMCVTIPSLMNRGKSKKSFSRACREFLKSERRNFTVIHAPRLSLRFRMRLLLHTHICNQFLAIEQRLTFLKKKLKIFNILYDSPVCTFQQKVSAVFVRSEICGTGEKQQ